MSDLPIRDEIVADILGKHADDPRVEEWVREFRTFMATRSESRVEQLGFWDQLGLDEACMPIHLPMPLNAQGQGPADPHEAVYLGCWCPDPKCLLASSFRQAYMYGCAKLARDEFESPT